MTLGSKSGCKPSRKPSHPSASAPNACRPQLRNVNSHISSQGAISGSSSSRHIQHSFSSGTRRTGRKEVLSGTEIQARTSQDHLQYQERISSMTITEIGNITALHSEHVQAENDDTGPAMDIMDILSGQDHVDISHAGGEFADLLAIGEDLLGPSIWYFVSSFGRDILLTVNASRPPVRDYRTRRNRTQRRTEAFTQQLPSLVRAYMEWMHAMGERGLAGEYVLPDAEIQGESQINVIDILGK